MTCFWDSLISSIHTEDFKNIFNYKKNNKPNPTEFVLILKSMNSHTNDILWNDTELLKSQLKENFDAVNELDTNKIFNGYDCSIFDPFLFLICQLVNISIYHNYNGNLMVYQHKTYNRYTLKFKSNTGHFQVQ